MFKIYKNLYLYLRVMKKEQALTLTPSQQKIFTMLKSYRDELQLKTVLRVAGGWVRDKIMGKESHDIDIALDNMKGEQFVTLLKQCAEKNHQKISGFGVTKFNPELSKHLQTATAQIYNHWIDFVNLRSEKYSEDSRIPTIQIGTPKQDAERRDFTINSMFYNLDSQQIQDWTGHGIEDLKNGILRTPLDPHETFKDDPLRILRCIRFKSRFSFKVQPSIYKAFSQPDIQQALQHKVSKQRVGTQLAGILKANHFIQGLRDIKEYQLWNIIFEVPKQSTLDNQQYIQQIPGFSLTCIELFHASLEKHNWITQKQLISHQIQQQGKKSKKKKTITYEKDQLTVMLSLSCLTKVYYPFQMKVGKTKTNLTEYMIKDNLKYSAKHSKFASHFCEGVQRLNKLRSSENNFDIIRWLRFIQQKWELCIHFLWACREAEKTEAVTDLFKLREHILNNGLEKSYLVEPPVDGTFLTKKGVKGPIIGKILENAIIWQIINPQKQSQQFILQFQSNPQFFKDEKTYR